MMFDVAGGGRSLFERQDHKAIREMFDEQIALHESLKEQIRQLELELTDELEVFDRVNEKVVRYEIKLDGTYQSHARQYGIQL